MESSWVGLSVIAVVFFLAGWRSGRAYPAPPRLPSMENIALGLLLTAIATALIGLCALGADTSPKVAPVTSQPTASTPVHSFRDPDLRASRDEHRTPLTKPAPKPLAPSLSRVQLDRLGTCEARTDGYTTNTGNGYYGRYQFSQATWTSNGGKGRPDLNTPQEQDRMARLLYTRRGASPWPHCGLLL